MNNFDGVQTAWLGGKLHLNHGPIDLLLHAQGHSGEIEIAYENAQRCFRDVLTDLVEELPLLRTPLSKRKVFSEYKPRGTIARQMVHACVPFRSQLLSPMAAVAGAVDDHMLAALNEKSNLQRAWVNNGGDIAFSLQAGQRFSCGLVPEVQLADVQGKLDIKASDPVRGIATSGWASHGQGGRSFSLGIADAVTVLAKNAACADVAATMIANRVDLPEHDGIGRVAARELDPDSDLGSRRVTTHVPALSDGECHTALDRGRRFAQQLQTSEQIFFAVLFLQKQFVVVGNGRFIGSNE